MQTQNTHPDLCTVEFNSTNYPRVIRIKWRDREASHSLRSFCGVIVFPHEDGEMYWVDMIRKAGALTILVQDERTARLIVSVWESVQ